MANGLVIVGAGQAGFQAAVSARALGYEGVINLVGDESYMPYQRPPLSKAFLLGKMAESGLSLQRPEFYDAKNIQVTTGVSVVSIDRIQKEVSLSSGMKLPYEHLILATGSRSRKLNIEGDQLDGVHYLRNLPDALALKQKIEQVDAAVVIGGGFIGLEFAAVAREKGLNVTVLEAADRLMARVASPVLSEYMLGLHRRNGVDVRLEAGAELIEGSLSVSGVGVRDVGSVAAQLVVIGAGAIPNSELAQACSLCGPGAIPVDELLRTADRSIFAIGDCAAHLHQGKYQRLESVQNAVDQGKHVARVIQGDVVSYSAVPWFWSDQYGVRLQIAGLVQEADERVVRGDVASDKFSVFSFLDGVLQGVESVNCPADHVLSRKLLLHPHAVGPQDVKDLSLDLKALAKERIESQGVLAT